MNEENLLDRSDVRDLANDLLNTCLFVQFLGVSAAFVGFFAFREVNLVMLPIGGFHFWICVSPLLMAYSPIVISFTLPKAIKNNPKKVLWFCWLIFFSDAVFLGLLVWFSGGPSNSFFTPLFLLIPSAASCFSIPKKRPFWILTTTVLAVYAGVMYSETFSSVADVLTKNTQYDVFYFFRLLFPNLFNVDNMKSLAFDSKGGGLLVGVFTLLCIATAAYCYWRTYSIKNVFMENHKDALEISKQLYI